MGEDQEGGRAENLAFTRDRPTIERGRDRWGDFAVQFRGVARDYGVTEEQAKRVLYDAITGSSSRLVITSLSPELPASQEMTFGDYMQTMGEKFMPAAESIQMEAEYRERKQGKLEDVQNYINTKHEVFLMAFPNAQACDRTEFYRETTEGFLNKYVRDQMFCYEPVDVESFGARAVNVVQIERRRIRIGDSDTKRLDGLVPVTRPIKEGPDYEQASRRPQVAANAGKWEGSDSGSEEDEAGRSSRRKPGRCHGIQPKEGPEGGTAPATAGAAAGEPKGRGLGLRDEARLWNDRETVAALEFSQLPPSRKGAGTWQSRGGGPELRAEGRSGAAALSPPGRQSFCKRPEDPP